MNLLITVVGMALAVVFFVGFLLLGRSSPESTLLAEVTGAERAASRGEVPQQWWKALPEYLAKPLGWLRGLFSNEPNAQVTRRLMLAGYRKPYHPDFYIGARLAVPAIFAVLTTLWINNVFLWIVIVGIAFFLPEFWLNHAITKRREKINLSLPDALDLLAICVAAGLGLDQALVRVGDQLQISHREMSEEFLQINLEQRVGTPRIDAWRSFADRAGSENVQSFVNMLVQTERFGTPISKSLGAFSDSLRLQRRQKAEELAAKTTIKLVLPLVFCIFPSIFIVTVAPAIITVIKSFRTVFIFS